VAAHSAAPASSTTLLHTAANPVHIPSAEPLSAKGRIAAFLLSVRPPPVV